MAAPHRLGGKRLLYGIDSREVADGGHSRYD